MGRPQQARQIDFTAIKIAALAAMPWLLFRILPGGVVKGTEYTVRNPTRPDKTPGSFKINVRTGKWADFAVGEYGGDIVSLFAYLNRTSQLAAARDLASLLGVRS